MHREGLEDVLEQLRGLSAEEFEYAVADVWDAMGWDVRVTQASNDYGVDVIAERFDPVHEKHVIQAKRYAADTTLGGPEVRQYAGLFRQIPDADAVVIVTSGGFSTQAREIASDTNVKLVGAEEFAQLYREHVWEPPARAEDKPSTPDVTVEPSDRTAASETEDDSTMGAALASLVTIGTGLVLAFEGLQAMGDGSAIEGLLRLLISGVFIYAFWKIMASFVDILGTPFPF